MNNNKLTIQYLWQRLKSIVSRLFAIVKFDCVASIVALVFVISNYTEVCSIVGAFVDEQIVLLFKTVAQLVYGSSSALFALEQTFILVAMPAIGMLVRAICTFSFVSLVVWLLCLGARFFVDFTKVVLPTNAQCEHPIQREDRYLTLCKFIS